MRLGLLLLAIVTLSLAGCGGSYVQETTERVQEASNADLACNGVRLAVFATENTPGICTSGEGANGQLRFTVANQGISDAAAISVVAFGGEGLFEIHPLDESALAAGEQKTFTANYDYSEYGPLYQLRVYALVTRDGRQQSCVDNSVTIESQDILQC